MSKANSCIFFREYEKGMLELVVSVHVYNVLMAGKPETLNNIKERIKENFNISESGKVNNFLVVYYEWGRDAKYTYAKITMDKDVKKLINVYEKYTGGDLKVQKNP